MKSLNVLAAFIGGAIAGAALGILFAPEKGEDTRSKIAETLRSHGIKLSKEDFNKLVSDIEKKIRPNKGGVAAEEVEA